MDLPEIFPAREAEREHSARLLNSLQSMRLNDEMADVILVCEDGHEFLAHRLVLAACSSYFRNEDAASRMSYRTEEAASKKSYKNEESASKKSDKNEESTSKKSDKNEEIASRKSKNEEVASTTSDKTEDVVSRPAEHFTFDTISKEDMTVLIEFIYTGKITTEAEIKLDADRLKTLLQSANTLGVLVLVQWCLQRIAQAVDINNYQDMFILAEDCHNPGLTSRIVTFVAQNFTHLVTTKQIVQLGAGLMKRVLIHPEMVQIETDDIVRAIFRWVESDPERKKQIAYLIQPLDLSYLSKDYLCMLMGSNMIKNDRDLLAILVGESTRRAMNVLLSTDELRRGKQLVCFGKSEQERVARTYDVDSSEWLQPKTPPFNFEVGMAIVGFGRNVYIFGGGGWPPNPSTLIIEYSPTSNIASDMEGTLSAPVCRAGAVVCDDAIYIVNGLNKDGLRTKTVQCFSPGDGACHTVAATNDSHFCPYGFAFNNCLYIVGSFNDEEKAVERYDPLCDHWTVITRIPGSIEWCRAAAIDDKLFIVKRKDETQIQLYNISSGEWETKEFQMQEPLSSDWGMWACKRDGKPTLIMRFADDLLYAYSLHSGEWEVISEPNTNPWQYQLTCFVWC